MEQSDLDLLQTAPSYHLQALIKPQHLPTAAHEQEQISSSISDIADRLFASDVISAALRDLNDLEQRILRELVACGGRANSRDLALYLTKSHLLDAAHSLSPGQSAADLALVSDQDTVIYPTAHPHGPYEQALHRLLARGLVFWGKQTNFAGRDYTNGVYDGILIVPHAVREIARDCFAPDTPQSSTPAEPVVLSFDSINEGIRSFQRALYIYWSTVAAARDGLPLVSSGLLARGALRQVIDALDADVPLEQVRSEMDVPRLFFTRLLLQQLGLLRARSGSAATQPAVQATRSEAFFARPLLERARLCVHAWLEGSFWNELAYLPNVVTRPGPQPLEAAHEEAIRARSTIVDLCVSLPVSQTEFWRTAEPPGAWLDTGAFIAHARLYAPHLLFPRQYGARADRYSIGSNPYGWDFRLRHGWLTHREGWHMVEGGFIRAVLFGPLRWLGLVETRQENGGAQFIAPQFRVSTLLSLLMADAPPVSEDVPWGKLIVQPNFDLIALAPVSEALLVRLDRFAERVKLEHVAQYRLSKASVTRAIQQGMRAEDILSDLHEAADAGVDIPQNVRYSLVEWERQARRVELWEGAALIEVDDPALLDSLLAQNGGAQFIAPTPDDAATLSGDKPTPLLRRLSPVLAMVASARLPDVQRALWQRDYLPITDVDPRFIEGSGTGAREDRATASSVHTLAPQWRLHDDGSLQPLYAVTDLYLAAGTTPFTVQDEQTGWRRITPSSLQQAIESGRAISDILRFLQAHCEGGIPPSLLIRLKLWGGGYDGHSTMRVEDMPMLSLSEQTLHDIQADEAINSLLGDAVAPEGRLVRIPREHLDQVIALLRERGFEIS